MQNTDALVHQMKQKSCSFRQCCFFPKQAITTTMQIYMYTKTYTPKFNADFKNYQYTHDFFLQVLSSYMPSKKYGYNAQFVKWNEPHLGQLIVQSKGPVTLQRFLQTWSTCFENHQHVDDYHIFQRNVQFFLMLSHYRIQSPTFCITFLPKLNIWQSIQDALLACQNMLLLHISCANMLPTHCNITALPIQWKLVPIFKMHPTCSVYIVIP